MVMYREAGENGTTTTNAGKGREEGKSHPEA